eukprot:626840_1
MLDEHESLKEELVQRLEAEASRAKTAENELESLRSAHQKLDIFSEKKTAEQKERITDLTLKVLQLESGSATKNEESAQEYKRIVSELERKVAAEKESMGTEIDELKRKLREKDIRLEESQSTAEKYKTAAATVDQLRSDLRVRSTELSETLDALENIRDKLGPLQDDRQRMAELTRRQQAAISSDAAQKEAWMHALKAERSARKLSAKLTTRLKCELRAARKQEPLVQSIVQMAAKANPTPPVYTTNCPYYQGGGIRSESSSGAVVNENKILRRENDRLLRLLTPPDKTADKFTIPKDLGELSEQLDRVLSQRTKLLKLKCLQSSLRDII